MALPKCRVARWLLTRLAGRHLQGELVQVWPTYGLGVAALGCLGVLLAHRRMRVARRTDERRPIGELVQVLAREPSRERVAAVVVGQAQRALGATAVGLWLVQPERGALELAAHCGLGERTPAELRAPSRASQVPVAQAALTGLPQEIPDLLAVGPELAEVRLWAERDGWRSLFAQPLVAGGLTVGVLAFLRAAPRRLTRHEREHARTLADVWAVAIEHATLRERAARSGREAEEARQLGQAREGYVHAISHDLRAPLTIVLGQAQIIERTADEPATVLKSAETIVTSARRMNAMIQDLVDSARLESGQVALNRAEVDLRQFALDLKERLAGALAAERIRVEAPENLPPVLADPDRLERILTNLLANALKYSEPSTEVTLALVEREGEVVASVSDQGTGIAAEELPHLFDRYYRTRGALEWREGLGLGLYIVRGLVEAHGGHIWAESEPGKGSTFGFTLPLAPPAQAGWPVSHPSVGPGTDSAVPP